MNSTSWNSYIVKWDRDYTLNTGDLGGISGGAGRVFFKEKELNTLQWQYIADSQTLNLKWFKRKADNEIGKNRENIINLSINHINGMAI